MTQPYGTNHPPIVSPNALVTGIAFSTSLVGAVIAGAGHPVAGLGVLAVSLLGALGIHHILWLAEEREATLMTPEAPVDPKVLRARRARVYPVGGA